MLTVSWVMPKNSCTPSREGLGCWGARGRGSLEDSKRSGGLHVSVVDLYVIGISGWGLRQGRFQVGSYPYKRPI